MYHYKSNMKREYKKSLHWEEKPRARGD